MNGTCYTASECANKGGMSGGNCASGSVRLLFTIVTYCCNSFLKSLEVCSFAFQKLL